MTAKNQESNNPTAVASGGLVESNVKKHTTESVLVRGDISSRIFSTWVTNFLAGKKIPESSFRN